MAAAQQLGRAGHDVHVYERESKPGGLMRFGIPDFKMEKRLVERRVEQMRAEGVVFETGVDVGRSVTAAELRDRFDAICLAMGSRKPRDLPIAGRELDGVHFAMDFLEQQNRRGLLVVPEPVLSAEQFLGSLMGHVHLRALVGVAHPTPAEVERLVEHAVRFFLRAHAVAQE